LVILVTGSRKWQNPEIVEGAFQDVILACAPTEQVILRHGNSGGLDKIADKIGKRLGMKLDPQDPDWTRDCDEHCDHGPRGVRDDGSTYCKAAGPHRNQGMVDALPWPTVCLAFPIGGAIRSRGTFDCATRAQRAGLPVWWYELPQ
jgi:hypothetical protein